MSHVNPIFYLVSAVRYGFLGTSEVDPLVALAVVAVLTAGCIAWTSRLFASGRRLKP